MSCRAEDEPKEWPGPKAWPATLALISFFAVNVFGQVQASRQRHDAMPNAPFQSAQ